MRAVCVDTLEIHLCFPVILQIACFEVSWYMVRGFDCVFYRSIFIPSDDIFSLFICTDVSDNFIDNVFCFTFAYFAFAVILSIIRFIQYYALWRWYSVVTCAIWGFVFGKGSFALICVALGVVRLYPSGWRM